MKHVLLVAVCALLFSAVAVFAQEPQRTTDGNGGVQRLTAGGVAVSFEYVPQAESSSGVTRLTFEDAASGRALGGARPAAWWVARRSPAQIETACSDRARSLAQGSLGSRADVDLNAYRLVTLNQDRTVVFLDPFVKLHTSRLQGLVELPGHGHDALWLREARLLVVSVPEADAVAVIDTQARRLRGLVKFEPGSRPTRLVRDGTSVHVWVGLDGRGDLTLIDAAALTQTHRVAIGQPGVLLLAASNEAPLLAVANAQDSAVAIVDRHTRQVAARTKLDAPPAALAWSSAARSFAVVSAVGSLTLLDEQAAPGTRIALEAGAPTLALLDGGRLALVANANANTVSLIDLASGRVQATAPVAEQPDQIVLSADYAYVRSVGEAAVTMLPLGAARNGRLEPVRLPLGSAAPSSMPRAINAGAPMIVPAPEGRGAWIAHAPDRLLYRYTEGLMAAAGSLGNDKRQPRGLLVLDDNLRERGEGRFEAFTQPPHGGTYDVIVALGQPALAACFTAQVAGPSAEQVAQAAVRLVSRVVSTQRERDGALRIELALSGANGAPLPTLTDAELMVFDARTQWQQRAWLREVAPGRYAATIGRLPAARAPAELVWLVGSHSQGAPLAAHRLVFDSVIAGAQP
jgi:YVTN family beta-propeller protein